MIVVRLVRHMRRQQADPRRVAEQQNAADVVADHSDAERQPEFIERDEHAERHGHEDPGIARHGRPALAHAVEQAAGDEWRRRVGELQAESTAVGRRCRGFGGGRDDDHRRRGRFQGIRKLRHKLAGDGIGIEADRARICPDELPAKDSRGPPRHIAALERCEEGCADLRVGRNGREGNLPAFALLPQTGAQGHFSHAIVGHHRDTAAGASSVPVQCASTRSPRAWSRYTWKVGIAR